MKKLLIAIAIALALITGCSLFSTSSSLDQRFREITVERTTNGDAAAPRPAPDSSRLRLLSLNMAHGRKDSFSQIFVSEAQIRSNLAEIAEFLKRENADIVTLQEADSPSRWSGSFDHVELLAREAGYAWYTHANHVDNWLGTYGTAVLSRLPIRRGYQVDFNPTPPTTRKGFTLAEIEWSPQGPTGGKQVVDVISVHLDFLSQSSRIEQIDDMRAVLGDRHNPVIVLGDFNTTWQEGERQLHSLANAVQLKTHRPEANHLFTYGVDRFDWIFISADFEYCRYATAPDNLSDHLAVISEIAASHGNEPLASCDAD